MHTSYFFYVPFRHFLFIFKFFLKESKKIAKVNRECDDIYRNVRVRDIFNKRSRGTSIYSE